MEINPSYLDEDNHSLSLEYYKIKKLSEFRSSLIDYFAPYTVKKILQHNSNFSKPNIIYSFFVEIFVKWFFNNNINGNIKAFVPLKFEILDRDLQYIVARNSNKELKDISLEYDTEIVNKSLFKLHNSFSIENITNDLHIKIVENNEFNRATNKINKNIKVIFNIKNENSKEIIISGIQFERLKELYTVNRYPNTETRPMNIKGEYSEDFLNTLGILLLRYDFLGSMNEHLSVPPKMLNSLKIDTELFGTPLNTTCSNFCSPFYDIEKYFGSSGSFINLSLKDKKLYIFNPPFDEELMKSASEKVIREMDKLDDIVVIATLPVWDSEGQKELNIRDNGMTFEAFDILKNSEYCREKTILHKNIHLYYNYFDNRFVSVSYTHLLILSKKPLDETTDLRVNRIVNLWREAVFRKN